MSSLSDIKRRIASVKQTRQITGAMETVSVAKMRKALDKYEKSRAYNAALYDVMSDLANSEASGESMLFNAPTDGKDVIIVLSSDRGLCGGFDHEIFKATAGHITDNTVIMPVGKVACEYYRAANNVDDEFGGMYAAENSVAENIAHKILEKYGNGVKTVSIAYCEYLSRGSQAPRLKQILPIEKQSTGAAGNAPYTEVNPALLSAIAPIYVSNVVFDAILNNTVSEHSARHAAMSAATESADGIISTLSVEYNRARQAKVTNQIVEIIGSVAALEKAGSLQ